jgi:predicted nucleotidyltransferase
LYRLNRSHLGADAILAIATIRARLLAELRRRIGQWDPPPEFAALFGSAADGTMRADSDIDLFIVRPRAIDPDLPPWRDQVDAMARDVTSWTGNDTRVLEYGTEEVSAGRAIDDPVLNDIRRGGLVLHGPPSFLRRRGAKD